jgi:hypothetical protein
VTSKKTTQALALMGAMMAGLSAGVPSFEPRGRTSPKGSRGGKCPSCRYPQGGATCRKIHETDPKNKKPV